MPGPKQARFTTGFGLADVFCKVRWGERGEGTCWGQILAETFRVELVGFPGVAADAAVVALAEAFGLSEELARTYVAEAPVAVRSGLDGATTRHYTKELLRIGATVRVVGERSGKAKEFVPAAARPAQPKQPPPKIQRAEPPRTGSDQAAKTQSCPVCGHRQAPASSCDRCGYALPKTARAHSADVAAAEADDEHIDYAHDDVDVFANLRTTGERRAVSRSMRRARKRGQRIKAKARRRSAGSGRRRRRLRIVVLGLLAVLAIATIVFMAIAPGDDSASDPVPEGSLPAPPGFSFRRE